LSPADEFGKYIADFLRLIAEVHKKSWLMTILVM